MIGTNNMPAALTPEEKRQRNLAKLAEPTEAAATEQPVVRTATDRPARRTRGAFNGTTGKLKVDFVDPAYHAHWMNDVPGRIETAIDNGYEFVTYGEIKSVGVNYDLTDKVKRLVGKTESGEPMYAYLMKIHMDWYEEDQKSIQGRIDQIDQSIKSGRNSDDPSGFYTPREGIKIKASDKF